MRSRRSRRALWRVRILVVGRGGGVVDLEHLRGHVLDCVVPPSQFCLGGRVHLSLVDHGVLLHLLGRGCVKQPAKASEAAIPRLSVWSTTQCLLLTRHRVVTWSVRRPVIDGINEGLRLEVSLSACAKWL